MYQKILLPLDLNNLPTQEKAYRTAIKFAQQMGAKLHVHSVVPSLGVGMVSSYFPEDFHEKAVKHAEDLLDDFIKKHVPSGVEVSHSIGEGSIYRSILKAAVDNGSDMIVMASHHPELGDYLIGPNAAYVVRHCDCSVFVVRD